MVMKDVQIIIEKEIKEVLANSKYKNFKLEEIKYNIVENQEK